jgi:hypothetical protein
MGEKRARHMKKLIFPLAPRAWIWYNVSIMAFGKVVSAGCFKPCGLAREWC